MNAYMQKGLNHNFKIDFSLLTVYFTSVGWIHWTKIIKNFEIRWDAKNSIIIQFLSHVVFAKSVLFCTRARMPYLTHVNIATNIEKYVNLKPMLVRKLHWALMLGDEVIQDNNSASEQCDQKKAEEFRTKVLIKELTLSKTHFVYKR